MNTNHQCTWKPVPLSECVDPSIYGQKASSLARLIRAGFRVPPGFTFSERIFDAHLDRAGLSSEADWLKKNIRASEPEIVHERARGLSRRICELTLCEELIDALESLSADVFRNSLLAVRSSGAGEDCSDHSFAGQLDSILNVRGKEELSDAIRRVWASLWSERAIEYQRGRNASVGKLGVIVQEQVNAQIAGVLFTAAPTGLRHGPSTMLIEFCSGLGDRLVAGSVTPGSVSVDHSTGVIVERHPEQETGRNLAERDISALVHEAKLVEAHFEQPLDIEWAIDAKGELWLLQVRPITSACKEKSSLTTWSNANIAENFPGTVTPFLYSIVRPGYAHYFRNLALGFGIARSRVEALTFAFENIVGIHAGRLYYNLSNIHTVIRLAPGGSWFIGAFNQFIGAYDVSGELSSAHNRGAGARLFKLARIVVMTFWQYLFVKWRIARFERRIECLCSRTRLGDLANANARELSHALHEVLDIRFHRWNDAALADTAAAVCYGALQFVIKRWLGSRIAGNEHNNLLIGLPNLASHAPVQKLWMLSRDIRRDPALTTLFADWPSELVWRRIRDDPQFARTRSALDEFFEHWGFRSSGELTLTRFSPQEDPTPTLDVLRSYLTLDTSSPDASIEKQQTVRLRTTRRISKMLSGDRPLQRGGKVVFFRILLAATHCSISLRERARHKQAKLYVRLRHIALAIGRVLARLDYIDKAEDVFFLTYEEADSLLCGRSMFPYGMKEHIRLRRSQHEEHSRVTLPDEFELPLGSYRHLSDFVDRQAHAELRKQERSDSTMTGVGVCGGTVAGPGVVLSDASEAGRVNEGDIIVTRQTDPGWASAFFLAGGLVVERGGMLSHGAIIAREFGIPAVVGVREATSRIRCGDRVSVDGDRGVVELLP